MIVTRSSSWRSSCSAVTLAIVALVSPPLVLADAAAAARYTVVSTTVVLAYANAATWNTAVQPDVVRAEHVAGFVAPQFRPRRRFIVAGVSSQRQHVVD
jgi:hypothetical protein